MATVADFKNRLAVVTEIDETMSDIVEDKVEFADQAHSGWRSTYCAVCGDGSRTKGPRGGWYLDGDNVRYNCFNCGIKGAFTPEEEIPMSRAMKQIFQAYGITEYGRILFKYRDSDNSGKIIKEIKKDPLKDMLKNSFDKPDYLIPLKDVLETDIGKDCVEFLKTKFLTVDDHEFYISSGKTDSDNPKTKIDAKITKNRLIIPIKYHDKFLALQARDIYGNSNKKYINIGHISNAIHGLDSLTDEHKYIFVTEGVWDALHLNGVALITNQLNKVQADILNSFDKEKVVVPDRGERHNTMADKAVEEQGWGITAPRELRNCNDVVDAIEKYGELYTIHMLMNGVSLGDRAKLILKDL